MPGIGLISTLLREVLGPRSLPREPEPDLVMDNQAQVAAYAEAGRIDGIMSAAYLFHTARVTQVIQNCATVLDLGCGPATQLAQIAQFNPATRFIGVDLSAAMLADAQRQLSGLQLGNVELRQGDITALTGFDEHSVDGVISTMALHHMPTREDLERCFLSIRRVLRPGGAVYLTDFGRLKSLRSVLYFAYMNAGYQPHLFSLDYERSLRAAFLVEEFADLTRRYLQPGARLYATFLVPMLVAIKTADAPLQTEAREQLRAMRRALPRRYRRDLDDLRRFFRLGGLQDDPFSAG